MVELNTLTDSEIIRNFNNIVVSINPSIAEIANYFSKVKPILKSRNIDYSIVESNLDTKNDCELYCVILKSKKLCTLSQLSKNEADYLFSRYMTFRHPEKLKFMPKLIEFNNDSIRFGMQKHMGVLVLKSNSMINELAEPEIILS